MKKINKININLINSDYILKSIFTNIDYRGILKIVRINKRIQNRLGINLENYKKISDFPKYGYYTSEVIENRSLGKGPPDPTQFLKIIIPACCSCILFIYSIIYSILLVSLDSFDDSNTKENYNKSSVNTIKIINSLTFIFDGVIISTPFIIFLFLFKRLDGDYGKIKYIKSFIVIIINIAHFTFGGLIIWKLVLSYRVKKDSVTWFMVMDYIFLFLNFIYIIYLLILSCIFFHYSGSRIINTKVCILKLFEGIKIESYRLPENFDKWEKKERKKFILNNYHNYIYSNSQRQEALINSINNFRKLKGVQQLGVVLIKNIPEFIINKPAELFLNSSNNIFKLSNTKYLFKYPKGIFENEFNKKNENLMIILSNENLNQIQIISQEEYELIVVEIGQYPVSFTYNNYSSLKEDEYSYKRLYDDDYNISNLKNKYSSIIYNNQNEYFE